LGISWTNKRFGNTKMHGATVKITLYIKTRSRLLGHCNTYIHTHTHTHTHIYIYIYTHTHTHIYIYTHTHTFLRSASRWL